MQTSNSIYGSGLHPLSAPVPATDEMPTIVPHFTQKAYPYKPRAKTQLFSSTVAAGQRIVFEKAVPGQDLSNTDSFLATGKSYAGVLPSSRLDASGPYATSHALMSSKTLSSTEGQPLHVVAEKQVLRFFAYLQEGVPDSAEESSRFRKVLILHYLVDGTSDVQEPKEDNSGLMQGPVLYRHRVPRWPEGVPGVKRPEGLNEDEPEYFDWRHFMVGDEANMYGRVYHIYDADGYTRSWFAERGITLGPAENPPSDPVSEKLAKAKLAGGKSDTGHNRLMYPQKLYAEASLGKFIRDSEARRKFQVHDGQVLKFDCLWDDTGSDYGDKHHLVLQFFLADDTAEIRFVHANNDGYPSGPSLLRKGPLPKDWAAARNAPPSEKPELYTSPADLMIGKTVDVYGRQLQIRSIDPSTRAWYSSAQAKEEYACSPQPRNIVEHHTAVITKPVIVPPPHTGIGSEEDSLQSCYTFNVKPLKKDYKKWALNDGVVFRFFAKIQTSNSVDARRRFTIACYPSDDSISVYEPPIKNSGFKGGVFLKRNKHRDADGNLFTGLSFQPGTTVAIHSHKFIILDADKFTKESLPHVAAASPASPVAESEMFAEPALSPEVQSPSISSEEAKGKLSVTFRD